MCMYVRLLGSLAQNLFRRVGDDLADCAVFMKRGCVYKMRCLRRKFDDVGPDEGDGEAYVALPEHQAELVSGLEKFSWFGHMDRRTAQDYVHRGGQGCFIIRPSSSTRSLTLTLWHENRTYNILVRRREDGLVALGSKKHNELAFRTVEEMCDHYSRNELILYSGGELAGKTLLKFPIQVISQQPSTSQQSSNRINHHYLPLKLSLDRTENNPQTLEESVHRAAQRSMSLRTFKETKTNNQLQKNDSSSGNPVVLHQHHKSYENVMLLNYKQNNLTLQNRSFRSSMVTVIPNELQLTDKPHPSYENISHNSTATISVSNSVNSNSQTSLTSVGLLQKIEHNNQINDTGKENTENKRLGSNISDEESDRKRKRSSSSSSAVLTQVSIEHFQTKLLNKNSEQNNLVFKNPAVKHTERLLAPSEAEQKVTEKCKLNENEKTGCSSLFGNRLNISLEKIKSPLPSPKLVQKSQSFEMSNEKLQPNVLITRGSISKGAESSTSLTSLEQKEGEINQPQKCEAQNITKISLPRPNSKENSINAHIKSSLASTEFVSKAVKDSQEYKKLSSDSIEKNVEEQMKNSLASKILKTDDNFKYNERLKGNKKLPHTSTKNVPDFQTDIQNSLPTTFVGTSETINFEENTKNNIEQNLLTNFSNTSVAKLKEHFLPSTPLVQKLLKNSHSEENVDPIPKPNSSFPKELMKELQTQLKANDDDESNLPSTERKLNLLNSQRTINDKPLLESKLNKILAADQEPKLKSLRGTESRARLAACFFEELAKKNKI